MLLGVISAPARQLVQMIHAPGSSLARVECLRREATGSGVVLKPGQCSAPALFRGLKSAPIL